MTDRSEGLLSRVPESPASGPAWLVKLRRDAAARLREGGFPGKKHERWRFTSVREVVETAFETAALEQRAATDRVGDDGTFQVLLAGRPSWDASAVPSGVRVRSIAEALRDDPSALEGVLGQLAPREHFAALNAALFRDGVVVSIAEGAVIDRPIHIVHDAPTGAEPTATYPRVLVIAERASQAVLIESYLATDGDRRVLTNAVTEVDVRQGARLDHARVLFGGPQSFHLAHLAARLDRDAFYASRVVTLGGALSRLELDVRLAGEGAEAVLEGVYHVDGSEHVDHQVFVDHAAPHGTSTTRYRGLLDGRGHAVFNAMGVVRSEARGTNAHQENRNLLLSDDATLDTKPHLEIETDDVKASHGATVGAVDDAQLFYLRARGIPEAEARDVLTYAFVRALLEHIPHDATARRASDAVLARLPSGERIREISS